MLPHLFVYSKHACFKGWMGSGATAALQNPSGQNAHMAGVDVNARPVPMVERGAVNDLRRRAY